MNISQFDDKHIWHPYSQYQPFSNNDNIVITSGKGAYLIDEHNNSYLDAISSWWVNLHGHAHPYIAKKVSEQLNLLEHVIFAGFTHKPAVELASRLINILPSNQQKIFFSDNGSTAVEVALKMAIQYWSNQGVKKKKILAFENAYHGDTFGSMSVSARSGFTIPFTDFLFEIVTIPFPKDINKDLYIQKFNEILNFHENEIAAFIFEPLILGAGGMLVYDEEVLDVLMQICAEKEILTIADEVMTGFGRTGKLFAVNNVISKPDIMCLSKGLTGGTMPMGITSCSFDIFYAFVSDDKSKTLYHGHSYTANPLACVAALASMDLLLSIETLNNIHIICKEVKFIAEHLKTVSGLNNIRYIGTILAVDVETREVTSYFNNLRNYLYYEFLNKGVLMRPLGNTIYIMPPYCITKEELIFLHETIICVIQELRHKNFN